MSDEERDTSELDAQVDTIDDEPQQDELGAEVEGPEESKSFGEIFEEQEDTQPTEEELELYAGKYGSVEDLESGYGELQKKLSERDDYARFGQNVAPHWGEFQRWQSEGRYQQQQQQQPEPEPEMPMPWNPPHQYADVQKAIGMRGTESWEALSESERGNAESYLNYYDNKWNNWFTNPYQMMEELATPYINNAIQQHYGQLQAQMQASSFLTEHKDALEGHYQELDQLLASGVPADYAREIIVHRKAALDGKVLDDERVELQRKKAKLKGRVTRGPQRSGGTRAAAKQSMANRSFGDLLTEVAEQEGFDMDRAGRLGEPVR